MLLGVICTEGPGFGGERKDAPLGTSPVGTSPVLTECGMGHFQLNSRAVPCNGGLLAPSGAAQTDALSCWKSVSGAFTAAMIFQPPPQSPVFPARHGRRSQLWVAAAGGCSRAVTETSPENKLRLGRRQLVDSNWSWKGLIVRVGSQASCEPVSEAGEARLISVLDVASACGRGFPLLCLLPQRQRA